MSLTDDDPMLAAFIEMHPLEASETYPDEFWRYATEEHPDLPRYAVEDRLRQEAVWRDRITIGGTP